MKPSVSFHPGIYAPMSSGLFRPQLRASCHKKLLPETREQGKGFLPCCRKALWELGKKGKGSERPLIPPFPRGVQILIRLPVILVACYSKNYFLKKIYPHNINVSIFWYLSQDRALDGFAHFYVRISNLQVFVNVSRNVLLILRCGYWKIICVQII